MKILNVNGFTILHEKTDNDMLSIRCIVNAGSSNEKRNEYGVAHYLEHMFFKGTLKRNYKEINRITSEIGDTNAYTCKDRTVFYINTLAPDFKQAAEILTEMVFEPSFPVEEFEKEKTVILEEYQSSVDSPNRYFFNMVGESFWGTPRGHKTLGNKNTLINMKIDDLINFRNKYYVIDNLAFAVVGDISEEEVLVVFNELLSNVPSSYYEKLEDEIIDYGSVDCTDFSFNHISQQSIIAIINKVYSINKSYDTNYVQNIFAFGMGHGMHSLLFDRIREDLGLCYSIGMSLDSYEDAGALYTVCMLDEKNISLAKDEIFKIFEKVKIEGFDPKLLDIAKKNLRFDMVSDMQTSEDYAYSFIDGFFKKGRDFITFNDVVNKVERVTNDDIIRFANEILVKDNCKFVSMTKG